jgi:hypothetical protein
MAGFALYEHRRGTDTADSEMQLSIVLHSSEILKRSPEPCQRIFARTWLQQRFWYSAFNRTDSSSHLY